MPLSSAEAKKEYFLTADDLRAVPRETLSFGFGTGRPMNVFDDADLEAAAIAKHGIAGLAKKRAARQKREENKRKRDESAAAVEAPLKKQEREAKAAMVRERNMRIVGEPWDLIITSPESVAGTKAELVIGSMPPTGWPGESNIGVDDLDSPAYSYGNIHGFKGKSSEEDVEMVFETKWKVCGMRHTGKLSVQVKPSDRKAEETTKEKEAAAANAITESMTGKMEEITKENRPNSEDKPGEEPLMVVGKFDSGFNDGVRRWSFKGYRK